MMKRLAVAALLITLAGMAFASPRGSHDPYAHPGLDLPPYVAQELQTILEENAAGTIGSLTGEQLRALLERMSVAAQKQAFVARSKAMSFMLPGLGQMVNKDYTAGTLFLLADVALFTGTALGAYFLLPGQVRFDQLDYFDTSFADIRVAWEGQSFRDYLPSMAVMAGGGLAMAILGGIASEHAGRLAERNVADGTIRFEPRLLAGFLPAAGPGPHGGPGGGWRMGWAMGVHY